MDKCSSSKKAVWSDEHHSAPSLGLPTSEECKLTPHLGLSPPPAHMMFHCQLQFISLMLLTAGNQSMIFRFFSPIDLVVLVGLLPRTAGHQTESRHCWSTLPAPGAGDMLVSMAGVHGPQTRKGSAERWVGDISHTLWKVWNLDSCGGQIEWEKLTRQSWKISLVSRRSKKSGPSILERLGTRLFRDVVTQVVLD